MTQAPERIWVTESSRDGKPEILYGQTADPYVEYIRADLVPQWQPIETAPRDMTEVIVLCGRKDVRLGWYFAPSSITFGWRDQRSNHIRPTHWMPLPAPPA